MESSSTGIYTPWETIEVIPNTDDGFICKRCKKPFALIALFEYPHTADDGLRKALPYWCERCDTLRH